MTVSAGSDNCRAEVTKRRHSVALRLKSKPKQKPSAGSFVSYAMPKICNWKVKSCGTALPSYHWSCARGRCTIWNLSLQTGEKDFERRQTIEVNNNRTIVQSRGLANCDPRAEEWAVVKAWAAKENLEIAPYLG